jgi:hypothetical protein
LEGRGQKHNNDKDSDAAIVGAATAAPFIKAATLPSTASSRLRARATRDAASAGRFDSREQQDARVAAAAAAETREAAARRERRWARARERAAALERAAEAAGGAAETTGGGVSGQAFAAAAAAAAALVAETLATAGLGPGGSAF